MALFWRFGVIPSAYALNVQHPERRPALVETDRKTPLDPDYLLSEAHFDNAFGIEAEMLVAFARQMLYRPDQGVDPFDTPVIRQRRSEAAKAALDLLWAMLGERNAEQDDPPPTPAILALRLTPQRRIRRLGR
jgi:hypothetical protein